MATFMDDFCGFGILAVDPDNGIVDLIMIVPIDLPYGESDQGDGETDVTTRDDDQPVAAPSTPWAAAEQAVQV